MALSFFIQMPFVDSPIYCLIVQARHTPPSHGQGLVNDAHALGFHNLARIERDDLYFVQGALNEQERERLAVELLTDPVAQTFRWRTRANGTSHGQVIEVALRPGVTDSVAEQIVRAAHALGLTAVERAATGQRYTVHAQDGQLLSEAALNSLARRLLANEVIQYYVLGEIEPTFPQAAQASGIVDILPLTELSDDELLALSQERRAALDLNEMRAIQHYFRRIGREPTDLEFEMLAQTWSEHCVHKTFKAKIEVRGWRLEVGVQFPTSNLQRPISNVQIDGLLKTYLRAATEEINAPWVRSAFVDNAGIIDFDDEYEISFKVETHNHPSAIEPFGGANTGVGGVIRDILGVSAKPIAATDVLCFGPQDIDAEQLPEGVLHPRRIRSGVVAGIQDYGNKIGIPTVSGAMYYDAGYTANPLVFCGCVGIAPKDKHPRAPQPGDRVIVLGGRTGRDGLRGATFSSMTMDAQTGKVAGASVQIGDPITEKGLIEVIVRARDAGLYHAITDCGAGGLSSAIGEMAQHTGVEVELERVPLKYPGLAPWEIWLSEAQERMVLAVLPENVQRLQEVCDAYAVELTDIGAFNESRRVSVKYENRRVLELENDFLHKGMPQRKMSGDGRPLDSARGFVVSAQPNGKLPTDDGRPRTSDDSPNVYQYANQTLLKLLAHPNIASKADVIRMYDHEVQGGTAVKPLIGVMNDAPSDAVVIKPLGTKGTRGIVLSCGINPEYGKHDPYRMALSVIDEAVRNAVAVGADPERIALLDNFCWGDPQRPETLGALVEAARGCYEGARLFQTPFISGKDSLNNEYLGADGKRHAIPPTLLISALGMIEDVNQAVTMDLKQAGNYIYRVGVWSRDDSHVPPLSAEATQVYRALHQAMRVGLVRACHDLSEGGLGVAAAEMCIGGRLGISLEIESDEMLLGETNGCLLVEVSTSDGAAFEACFEKIPSTVHVIGRVTAQPRLEIRCGQDTRISLDVDELVRAFNSPLTMQEGAE